VERPVDVTIRPCDDLSAEGLLAAKREFNPDDLAERSRGINSYGDEWFVATVDDAVIGWILIKWRGKPTHPEYPDLEDVWVSESWRGLGVGTALLQFAEKQARRRGCAHIGLAVNPTENPRAKELYERLCYAPTGEDMYVDDVYDGHEDWVIDLEKRISGLPA
jgi:GNAT superfamily N-acetyltransferase